MWVTLQGSQHDHLGSQSSLCLSPSRCTGTQFSKKGSVLSGMNQAQKVKPVGSHLQEVPRCQAIWNQGAKCGYFEWGICVSLGRSRGVLWTGC